MIVTKDKLKLIIKEEIEKELNEIGRLKKAMLGAGAAFASMIPSVASAKQTTSPPAYTSTASHYSLDDMNLFLKIQERKPEVSKVGRIYQDILSKGNAEATSDAANELTSFGADKISLKTCADRLSTIKARLYGGY